MSASRLFLPATAMFAVALGGALPAEARSRGIVAISCDGCHGSANVSQLTLTPDRATFNPGDAVTFTLTIKWASIRVGGTYVTADVGTLRALSGEGLAINGKALMHTAAKTGANGEVVFRFGWTAPSTPSGLNFEVAALAGNGNNNSSGDAPGYGEFQYAFGCTARTFFRDSDLDGYGSRLFGTRIGCADSAVPAGYSAQDGDCDENDERVNPGAAEICNTKDDDCDAEIDENAPAVMLWPDGDGDGYYRYQTGTPKIGCGNVPGYAALSGDCVDTDPAIHPGAAEICNLKDDNCNGRDDERVRPQCGLGWCARNSYTCNPLDCQPGAPQPEACNLTDDDCDGEIDEDSCAAGMVCVSGTCMAAGDGGPVIGTGGAGGGAGAGSGGSGGASAGNGGTPGGAGQAGAGAGCAVAPPVGGRTSRPFPREGAAQAVLLAVCTALSLLRRRPAHGTAIRRGPPTNLFIPAQGGCLSGEKSLNTRAGSRNGDSRRPAANS
jgi:hypothetical protein